MTLQDASLNLLQRVHSKILMNATRTCQVPRFRCFRYTRSYSTSQPPRSESNRMPNMYLQSVVVTALSGAALLAYFNYEKKRIAELKSQKKLEDSSTGKPLIGGPFSLVDHDGKPVTDLDYRGKYVLLYFGYTFCPDVCPEELEKMAKVIDGIGKWQSFRGLIVDAKSDEFGKDSIVPLFVSCDPKRDSIQSIKEYLKDYHPKFIGLTGTHQQIKRVARAYRMYYSAPPRALDDDDADYLVDHSIFFYLINPEGKYVAHFGRQETAETVLEKTIEIMQKAKQSI